MDLDAHGYATLTVRPDHVEMAWHRVVDVTVAGSPVVAGPVLRYEGSRITA